MKIKGKFRLRVFLGVLVMHVLAVLAAVHGWVYDFPLGAWLWFAGLYAVSTIGISMGYHRLFTHHAFKCADSTKKFLAALGALAVEGPVKEWVRDHRTHHAFVDQDGDPHSPVHGFWWAHCLWVFYHPIRPKNYRPLANFDHQVAKWQRGWYWPVVVSGFVVPFLGGVASGMYQGFSLPQAMYYGWLFLLLAGPTRMVLHLHATWSVNSFGHTFGCKPKDAKGVSLTRDRSTNCWQIAIPTFVGEWLHEHHHRQPNCAYFGWRWWEFDLVKLILLLLEKWGVVWAVNRPKTQL